jgi:hypothetical protein
MLGISLLHSVSVADLPNVEVLVEAITRGLNIIDEFWTEQVIEYTIVVSEVVGQCLKVAGARCAFALHVEMWFKHLWEQQIRCSPRFTSLMGHLMSRFIGYSEFEAFVGEWIPEAMTRLFEWDRRRALDFVSSFVLKAPTLVPADLNAALVETLESAIESGDWSKDVSDVLLYFGMGGLEAVSDLCLRGLADGIRSDAIANFVTAAIGVMWTTRDRRVLDCLLSLVSENEESFFWGVVPVIAAVLYLGGRPLSREHMNAAIFLCCDFVDKGFSRCSFDARLVLGFECRMLTDGREMLESEQWGPMYVNVMTALEKSRTEYDSGIPILRSFYLRHSKLFSGAFAWIFDEWESYVETITRELDLRGADDMGG